MVTASFIFLNRWKLFILLGGLLIAVVMLVPASDQFISNIKWQPLNLIEEINTPYGLVSITRTQEQYDIYFDGQHLHTIPDVYSNELLAHLPAVQLKEHNRVLVIGGNPYGLHTELKKYDFKQIVFLNIDKRLSDTFKRYSSKYDEYADNPKIMFGDARGIIKEDATDYDLIILPGDNPRLSTEGRLYTKEFFGQLKDNLRPGGVFSLTFPGTGNVITLPKSGMINSIYGALNETFLRTETIYGPTIAFLSSDTKRDFNISPEFYTNRLNQLDVNNKYVHQGYLTDILSPFRQLQNGF
jgi:spermidine synthase